MDITNIAIADNSITLTKGDGSQAVFTQPAVQMPVVLTMEVSGGDTPSATVTDVHMKG